MLRAWVLLFAMLHAAYAVTTNDNPVISTLVAQHHKDIPFTGLRRDFTITTNNKVSSSMRFQNNLVETEGKLNQALGNVFKFIHSYKGRSIGENGASSRLTISTLRQVSGFLIKHNIKNPTRKLVMMDFLEAHFGSARLAWLLHGLTFDKDPNVVKIGNVLQNAQFYQWIKSGKSPLAQLDIRLPEMPPMSTLHILERYLRLENRLKGGRDSMRSILSKSYGEETVVQMLAMKLMSPDIKKDERELIFQMQKSILQTWTKNGLEPGKALKQLSTKEAVTFVMKSDPHLIASSCPILQPNGKVFKQQTWDEILIENYPYASVVRELGVHPNDKVANMLLDRILTTFVAKGLSVDKFKKGLGYSFRHMPNDKETEAFVRVMNMYKTKSSSVHLSLST